MTKTRKRWRIGGGALGFLVIYSVLALTVTWNSPEARLGRALQVIVAQQGLEFTETRVHRDRDSGELITWTRYEGEPISQEQKKLVLDQLSEFVPTYSVQVLTRDQGNFDAVPSSGPTFELIIWRTKDESAIVSFSIIFDDRGFMGVNDSPSSSLGISRSRNDSWLFLKSLWPW